ncbi:MAG: phosphoribosylformylglycinamidine synthase subunit PurS [Bacteroidetes bacterium]|nr:phosphoribosylformylglycinamidine synthase subunit PurS [Bacteroidota bacterium]
MFKARIEVTLKSKILDPQGKAIESSLRNLGFTKLGSVRTGKNIDIAVNETDLQRALELAKSACVKLLANPVTEEYEGELFDESGKSLASFSSQEAAASRGSVAS